LANYELYDRGGNECFARQSHDAPNSTRFPHSNNRIKSIHASLQSTIRQQQVQLDYLSAACEQKRVQLCVLRPLLVHEKEKIQQLTAERGGIEHEIGGNPDEGQEEIQQ